MPKQPQPDINGNLLVPHEAGQQAATMISTPTPANTPTQVTWWSALPAEVATFAIQVNRVLEHLELEVSEDTTAVTATNGTSERALGAGATHAAVAEGELKRRHWRVLSIERARDEIVLFEITAPNAMPEVRELSEVEREIAEGHLHALVRDPYQASAQADVAFTESARKIRNERWAAIQPLVEEPEQRVFCQETRGQAVAEAAAAAGIHRAEVYRYARLYWTGGQTPNALLPRFATCGAPGKRRLAAMGTPKRGIPKTQSDEVPRHAGVNITPEIETKLLLGARRFLEKDTEPTRRAAYDKTLQTFFNIGYEKREGVADPVPVLPDPESLPSLRQFNYVYERARDEALALRKRRGDRRFQLEHRRLKGRADADAWGPGTVFQIDATVMDVYLTSALLPGRLLGRPIVYLVIDVFSRMIVGLSVELEGPSWEGMQLALENTFTDKVAFCARYGREIEAADWPAAGVPQRLVGDRGELLSKHADFLVRAFNIQVVNLPPFRPDWKPFVERIFRTANDEMVRYLPGQAYKVRERGDPDQTKQAVLTLHDFTQAMIDLILTYNNSYLLESYKPDPQVLGAGVPLFPVELWEWGVRHRTGRLRSFPADKVRLSLLPGEQASVTEHGISFRGLHYEAPSAEQRGWGLRKTGRTRPKVEIAFDRRDLSVVYLRSPENGEIEVCPLAKRSEVFKGQPLYEAQEYEAALATRQHAGRARRQEGLAELTTRIRGIETRAKGRLDAIVDATGQPLQTRGSRAVKAAERDARRALPRPALKTEAESTETEAPLELLAPGTTVGDATGKAPGSTAGAPQTPIAAASMGTTAPSTDLVPTPVVPVPVSAEPAVSSGRYIAPPSELDKLRVLRRPT